MTKPQFRSDKATQIAATLIERSGGTINHMKLVKLMYLIERESLQRFGSPVIFDHFCSLDRGPIVSSTLNLINRDASEQDAIIWDQHITERTEHSVSLASPPNFDVLSGAEREVVDHVFEKFGTWDQWELVDFTHTFDEWKDPQGSMIPISYREVLEGLHKSPEDIEAILNEIQTKAFADVVFG